MGLAASQARLLTITARKSDCEFLSMSLSHQKIALARDMENISDEYQKALNQTKLVYDYYGSGVSQMNLDYGLFMTPSVYNDYYPKLLTDNKNRVVLDAKYASAARAAGIPAEGYQGTASSVIRDRFVEALADSSVISTATAVSVKSVPYNNATGLGGGITATVATKEITYDELLSAIKSSCDDADDYGIGFSFNYVTDADKYAGGYPDERLLSRSDGDWNFRIFYDDQENRIYNLNLYDLLNDETGKYVLRMETGSGATFPLSESAFLQQWVVGGENYPSFLNWINDQFSSILGGVSENDLALQYAYDVVADLLYPNEDIQALGDESINAIYWAKDEKRTGQWSHDHNYGQEYLDIIGTKVEHNYEGNASSDVAKKAYDYIGVVYSSCGSGSTSWVDGGGGRRQGLSLSLSNIAKVYLTAYVEYLRGVENSTYSYEEGQAYIGDINNAPRASLYKPNSDDMFLISAGTQVNDGEDNLVANFYDTLFNMICTHGWTENDKVGTDSEYMQELLKSGALFISSINNDGNYYQGNYSVDTYISEVADMDGIAQAEAKYNAEKAKIEAKENRIDVKMKNLDSEISALTTEYDTVKTIIGKSVEKSFKRYDA